MTRRTFVWSMTPGETKRLIRFMLSVSSDGVLGFSLTFPSAAKADEYEVEADGQAAEVDELPSFV